MKKPNYIILLTLFWATFSLQAQDKKETKFNILTYGEIGYAIVKNDNEPNYNLNSNSGSILLNYRINQKFGIASGVGLIELSGNGFNALGHFYHERKLLKIPLLATMDYKISDQIKMIGNFGFYTQNITKDEYQFLNSAQKNRYEGWNFGCQLGLGFVIKVSDHFGAGVNYSGQSDLSKFKTNNNQGINGKQQLKNLNSIGIVLMIDL